jgi:protein gp37
MNRTAIEWTDYTWNIVTGCFGPGGTQEAPKRCVYCYAKKMAHRIFWMQYQRKLDADVSNEELIEYLDKDSFAPTFHPERIDQPAKVKKPSKIFVCSMADLFGDWLPREWIEAVLNRTQFADYRHHTYQFLTKNPKRLKDFNPWPSNCWVGTTVTNQADANERIYWLTQVKAPILFVSHEPLMESIRVNRFEGGMTDYYPLKGRWQTITANTGLITDAGEMGRIGWAIIGAQTGPGAVKPKPEWVQGLIDQYRAAGVPVFLKDNLKWAEKIQEWPR